MRNSEKGEQAHDLEQRCHSCPQSAEVSFGKIIKILEGHFVSRDSGPERKQQLCTNDLWMMLLEILLQASSFILEHYEREITTLSCQRFVV